MALRTPKADVTLRDSADIRGSSAQIGADATWGTEIVLPGARFAADATYLQQGDDLVLIGTDGSTFVVRGYFLLENPPDLITPEGARMTPALVDSFTPPEATGQYAQAGQIAQAAEPIGQVKDLTGKAFAVRTDGTRTPLSAGDSVYQGDVIETADGGAINMVFVDQTTFALGGDARLALDELVYNPATQTGSSSFSIMKGVFVFVSGEIAKTDNTKMQVNTPVATIGIRGTKVAGEIKPAGEESKFTVIDGEIAVATQAGTVVMGDQNATTTVTSFSAVPTAPVVLSQTEVNQSYGDVRAVSGGILNRGGQGEAAPDAPAAQQTGEPSPDEGPEPDAEAGAEGEAGAEDEAAGEGGGEGEGEGAAEAEGTAEAEGAGAEGEAGEPEPGGPRGPGDGEAEGERPDGKRDGEQLAEGEGPGDPNGPAGEAEADSAGGEGPGEDLQNAEGQIRDGPFGEAGLRDGPGADGDGADGKEGESLPSNDNFTQGDAGFGGGPLGGPDYGFGDFNGGFGDAFGGTGDVFGGPGGAFGSDDVFGGVDDFLTDVPFDDLPPPPTDDANFEFIEEDDFVLDAPIFDDRSTLSTSEIMFGGNNKDTLIGGTGDDNIFGFQGADNLSGGAGNDTLTGGDGDDIVNGGAGDDFLVAGTGFGFDTYDGGAGSDTLSFSSTFLGITADLGAGTASGTEIDTDTLTNIEVLVGGAGGDQLNGDAAVNVIFGGAGDDTIDGFGGIDTIHGEAGDDTIGFDASAETINGGAGTDRIKLFGSGQIANTGNLVAVGSIEEIDLGGTGANTLGVTSGLITTMSGNGTLSAFGNGDDVVTSTDNWNLTGPVTVGGVTLDRFSDGGSTINSSVSEFQSSGTITFDAGAALTHNIVNQGTLVTADGTYTNNGQITLAAAGDIDMAGAKVLAGTGTFVNQQFLSLQDDIVAATLDGGSGTLGLEGNVTVDGKLILGAATTIAGGPLVQISGSGTLVNEGSQLIDDSATLSVNTIENHGLFAFDTLTSNITSPTINNLAGGTLNFLATTTNIDLVAGETFTNDGLVSLAGSRTLNVQDAVVANTGTLNIDGDLVLNNSTVGQDGLLQMASGGFIKLLGASVFNLNNDFTLTTGRNFVVGDGGTTGELGGTGTFTNDAVVALNNGTLSGVMDSTTGLFSITGSANLNSGVMDFNADNTLIFSAGADKLANAGTIDVNGNSTLTVDTGTLENLAAGTINVFGTGTIATASGGIFSDSGTTTFGLSPGSLTIAGDMLRGDTAFMQIELGGLTAGIGGFDQFTVTGELKAGGTIDVVEFGGFNVSVGDSFAAINAGTLTNSFREISGLDVGGGVVLDAVQSANGIVLTGRAVTHQGTASDETLTGGAGDDVIVGGAGADFIVSGGGADLMHGGDGDDIFIAVDTGFGRLDGEGGIDTVRFDNGSFDLTVLRGDQISGIERFDITGTGDNTLTLDTEMALAATSGTNALTNTRDSLLIDGDAGDVVNAQGAWSNTGTVTIDGNGYSVFENGTNDAQVLVDTDITVNLV